MKGAHNMTINPWSLEVYSNEDVQQGYDNATLWLANVDMAGASVNPFMPAKYQDLEHDDFYAEESNFQARDALRDFDDSIGEPSGDL